MNRTEAQRLLIQCNRLEKTYNGDYSEPDGDGSWRVVYTKEQHAEAFDVEHSTDPEPNPFEIKPGRPIQHDYELFESCCHDVVKKHGNVKNLRSWAVTEYSNRTNGMIMSDTKEARDVVRKVKAAFYAAQDKGKSAT